MIGLPPQRTPIGIADWIELELLFGEREALAETEIQNLIRDDLGVDVADDLVGLDDPDLPVADPSGQSDAIADVVADALYLLDARSRRGGDGYPFAVGNECSVEGSWSDHPVASFLALLEARLSYSLGGLIGATDAARLFEHVVSRSLANYLSGRAARFGWPLDEFTGPFDVRVEALASRMGEKFRGVDPGEIDIPATKDFGLDVAAWRYLDDRPSQVVILCQCGIGRDFDGKPMKVRRWADLIGFVTPPLGALALPFEESTLGTSWRTIALDADLLFDRMRLLRLARLEPDDDLGPQLAAWIDDNRKFLPTA